MGTAIGSVLRELRIKHNYQQQDITKMLNEMGIQTAKQQVSRWEHGYNNPNIPQFIGLCRIYGIKDAYKVFLQGDFSDLIYELNKEGADKLAEYKQILIASGLYAPMSCKPKIIPFPRRTAPMYDIGASAGTGQFLDSNSYEMVEVPECVPDSATFGLHVCGDSMESSLFDGEEIWVHQQPTLENGDIGIFLLDGDAYVKEFRVTNQGTFLVSHNPAYKPKQITEYSETRIYGKVIYPIR